MSINSMKKTAIIFDFDGTILDTELAEYLAWNEIYIHHGLSLERSYWQQRLGMSGGGESFNPLIRLQNLLKLPLDIPTIQTVRRNILKQYVLELKPRDGVIELIQESMQYNILLGIASSAPRKWVNEHLSRLGIRKSFNVVKCAEDAKCLKPDPELYISVLKDLGISASNAVAIEDSPVGIQAAKRAGIVCVAIPCELSKSLDLSAADLLLNSLSKLNVHSAIKLICQYNKKLES